MRSAAAVLVLAAALAGPAAAVQSQTWITTETCDGDPTQLWQVHPAGKPTIIVKGSSPPMCIDIDNYGTTPGSKVWVFTCHLNDKDPKHQNQAWTANANGTFVAQMSGLCLTASAEYAHSGIELQPCDGRAGSKWSVGSDGSIKEEGTGLCLTAGGVVKQPSPCDLEPGKSMPFCDTTKSFEQRVASFVGALQTPEKLTQFANGAGGIPRLNVPDYQWWSEALHGVAGSPGVSFSGNFSCATSFPEPITTAASFNATLFSAVAQVIGNEARAFYNGGHAGGTFWAPNVNTFRDPRWGRGQETQGEDPLLSSTYAAAFTANFQDAQGAGTGGKYLKASSCAKHWSDYSLEGADGFSRHNFNAIVTEQDQQDTYYPPFKAAVTVGKVSSLMCSYNAENGVPSCANKQLLTDLSRNTWGFEGYITSDCGAVADVYDQHHYTPNPNATCAAVLQAGMDIDCGGFLNKYLQGALESGAVKMSDVDTALTNQFMVRFRLGEFDPAGSNPFAGYGADMVNTTYNERLSLQAAREGMVLLQNTGALPLSTGNVKSVAVVGPNADATGVMQGNYNGKACVNIQSPQVAMAQYAKVDYVKGCDIASNDKSGFGAAASAAKSADATVIIVGLDQSQEAEGHDRTAIGLPGVQDDFIAAVADAATGPVAVVVMAGGSVDLSAVKANPKVGAIMWVGYPGQNGGRAIAETLFGDNNPGGRMPYTVYAADYVNQISMLDMGMRPNATTKSPGRSYRFFTGTPVFPFGTGLSYTTFNYTWSATSEAPLSTAVVAADLSAEKPWSLSADGHLQQGLPALASHTVKVTNTGKVAGDDVVLFYVVPPNAGQGGNPIKVLTGFQRVHLAPGASTTITFPSTAHDLSLVNVDGDRVPVKGEWRVVVGDLSAAVRVM